MPILEYECLEHGRFEKLKYTYDSNMEPCPLCGKLSQKIMSRPAMGKVTHKENLPLGSGALGKYVPSSETGGLPVYIPSFGALEKEEVEYTALVATEKEKERVNKKKDLSMRNPDKAKALSNIVNMAHNAPQGKRKETLNKVLKEGMV